MEDTLQPNSLLQKIYSGVSHNIQPTESDLQPSSRLQSIYGGQKTVSNAKALEGAADYNGLCQMFVEQQAYGKTGMYPTAVDAWNDNASKGNAFTDLNNAAPGDLVYFAPDNSNGGAGHTGVYMGGGKMISATYNGVQVSDINQWEQQTGQQALGYVKPQ